MSKSRNSASSSRGRAGRIIGLASILCLLPVAAFGQGERCLPANVMCTTNAGVKTCSAMHNHYPVTGLMSMHVGSGIQCTHSTAGYGMNNWIAMRPTTAPSTWACSWTGHYPASPGTILQDFFCRIDASDGLPVELLGFDIEETSTEETAEESE